MIIFWNTLQITINPQLFQNNKPRQINARG